MAWWLPILQAVGINAAKNVVTGQDPLKGSVEAGVTGGILGGFNGGNFLQGSSAVPTSSGAFEASMGLNNAYNAGSLAGLPGSGTIESVMGQAGADGVFRNKDYFSNILGSPTYTGNEGLLSQIGTGANSIWDTAKANLPDYVTPQNLMGAANIINNTQMPQRQFAPAGGVRQGQTQGLNVEMGGARPISMRRREDF